MRSCQRRVHDRVTIDHLFDHAKQEIYVKHVKYVSIGACVGSLHFVLCLQTHQDDAGYNIRLAKILANSGKPVAALQLVENVLLQQPIGSGNAELLHFRGVCQEATGNVPGVRAKTFFCTPAQHAVFKHDIHAGFRHHQLLFCASTGGPSMMASAFNLPSVNGS